MHKCKNIVRLDWFSSVDELKYYSMRSSGKRSQMKIEAWEAYLQYLSSNEHQSFLVLALFIILGSRINAPIYFENTFNIKLSRRTIVTMSNNQAISFPTEERFARNSTGSVSSTSAGANTRSSSSIKSSELRLVEQASASNKNVKKSSFSSAIKALAPGRIFRCVVGLYADRKLFILASFHIVATLICYGKKD